MPVITQTPIQLSYYLQSPGDTTYNRLRVWRSRTGQSGLYEAATAPAATGAVLEGTSGTPHQLNGKTLGFRVNAVTEVSVSFTDPDPVSTTQVIAAVLAETALVVASDIGGRVRLTTAATGSGASLEILESDAAPYLGLDVGAAAVGLDADITIVSSTYEYLYTDQNASTDFWYRIERIHATTAQTSGLGVPFQAGPIGTPNATKIWCFVRVVDLQGKPISGRVVTLINPTQPNLVSHSGTRWGVFRQVASMTTDSEGYAQVRLLRGMQVDIAVDGTNFVRRLQIPSTGESVDLFDPTLVVEDEFGIQEPQIDFALRTT